MPRIIPAYESTARAALVFHALVAVSALTLASCGDSAGPEGPLTGRWHADSTIYGTLDLVLTQQDTLVEGEGTRFDPPPPRPVVVIGFYSTQPASEPIALTLATVNIIPAIFTGALSTDGRSLAGRITMTFGQGVDTAVVFHRQ